MFVRLLVPVMAMAGLGVIFGIALAYALKIFKIEVDPDIFRILSLLPGSNCGACGKAGCAGFAQALKNGEVIPAGCAVSNEESRKAIAGLLGLRHESSVKTIATVLCSGGKRAVDKFVYRGIETCKAASLVFGGHKACSFGCLGFGDCVNACPFDAIRIDDEGLPVVDAKRCTACGNCVKVCPKSLYVLSPPAVRYYVKCSSKDTGALTAKVCKASCIACLKCQSACPAGAAKVNSNLSRIDPEKCQNAGKCFEVCPTKVIVKRTGD
jgi:Na+-translocating ferredoxin:NAD+ oxidoreductase RNF subunit RnfB